MKRPYVIFQLERNHYGIPADQVLQVEMPERITPVPGAAAFVRGIVNLRGQVLPVVDLRVRFGLPPAAIGLSSRLIVIRMGDRTLALLVDNAREFIHIEEEHILLPAEGMNSPGAACLEGIYPQENRLLLLLNAEKLLGEEQQARLESAQSLPGTAGMDNERSAR